MGLLKICFVLTLFAELSYSRDGKWQGCWKGNIIPYKIIWGFSQSQIIQIKRNINILHNVTCLRFQEEGDVMWQTKDATVWFVYGKDKCHMEVKRPNASFTVHVLYLNDHCFEGNWILHFMLYPLGFYAEHQRADRDCYVKVSQHAAYYDPQWKIIHREHEGNWLERFPYDKYSVMHYPRTSKMHVQGERDAWYYHWWMPLGNIEGTLTELDIWKLKYRFCNYPHFCDTKPWYCDGIEEYEKFCSKIRPPVNSKK